MVSILGKRARAAESGNDESSVSSRVKRRAHTPIANDENVDPHSAHAGRGHSKQNGMQLDELGASISPSKSLSQVKRADEGRRVALSPRKANGQGKAYKESSQDENVVQLPTPKTPRHRDALSKRVPITPRHRIGPVGRLLTPRTPRTPSTPSNAPTVYDYARQLFIRSGNPGTIIGREDERSELQTFIKNGIESKSGRCMYVSGSPGTGKSALVNEVCRPLRQVKSVKTAYINCMSAKSSNDVYGQLLEEFISDDCDACNSEQDELAKLRALFVPEKKLAELLYVVTLDEIDHLLTVDLEILYTLFEWSLHRSSRLIVIGIANALDLTDRFLPRLKARNLKPQLLPFLPYTAPQIASVVTTKLRSLLSSPDDATSSDFVPFLHPAAIQLCSKKVASQTGDLRKAFDIVRRTIDLIESETRQKHQLDLPLQTSPSKPPLGENPNLSSPPRPGLTATTLLIDLTLLTAPRVTIAHVSRVAAAALSNGTIQRLQTLNLQQKAALCALISHQKTACKLASSIFTTPSKSSPAPSVRQLYATYCTLCKREDALHPLTGTEFADVVSGLETLGLLGEETGRRRFGTILGTPSKKSKGAGEEKRVLSFVDEGEVRGCLDGLGGGILRSLLGSDE